MSLLTKYHNLLRRLETNTLEWVGLDIRSGSVKTIQGSWHNQQFTVTGAALMELADTDSPEDQKQKEIIAAIQNCLQKARLKIPYAVCAHSGPEVVTRHFQFPSLPTEALTQAVQLEAQQMSPFEADQGIVEFQTVTSPNTDTQGSQGFLVVAMRDAVEKKVEWVEAAGGKVMLMDVEGLAALNCLKTCRPKSQSETIALIHIGNRFTTVSILGENGIPFIRDLTYAGKNIRLAIRQQTKLSNAEIRKALFDSEASAGKQTELSAVLRNAATRSISDINETIRYYLTQNPGSKLNRIYLTGGWALSQPLVKLLADALPVEVEVFNPFHTLPIQAPATQETLMKSSGPALVVAAGLAMRTIV